MAKTKAVINLDASGAEIAQIGAVPLLRGADGELQIVLVTTRGSGRWTIPKGNPIKGASYAKTAEIEAREEAGLIGRAKKEPLGSYQFWKRQEDHWQLAQVLVFALTVKEQLADYKEKGERSVQAFSLAAAEANVVEQGLKALFRQLAGKRGGKSGKAKAKPATKGPEEASAKPAKKKIQGKKAKPAKADKAERAKPAKSSKPPKAKKAKAVMPSPLPSSDSP